MAGPPIYPRLESRVDLSLGYQTWTIQLQGYDDVRYFNSWAADAEVARAEDAISERRRKHWAQRNELLALQVWHGVRRDADGAVR